jgi:hypothetical protein
MSNNFPPPFENLAVYEIMSKNMVEPEILQMTIWRHVACWISKATRTQAHARARASAHIHVRTHALTHTHRICNIYCFSTATMVS